MKTRLEEAQLVGRVDELEARNLVASPLHAGDDVDDVVEVLAGVDTAWNREADELEARLLPPGDTVCRAS